MGKRNKLLGIWLAAALLVLGAAPGFIKAQPEIIVLDNLSSLYEPVNFTHAMHTNFTSCATCHHHTLGQKPVEERCVRCHQGGEPVSAISCRDCHASERFAAAELERIEQDRYLYHTVRPGLMGAFHQQCLGCHERMGARTGCTECHARSAKGEAFYLSGEHAPQAGVAGQ